MISPQHRLLILAHAADHLRGKPCPELPPEEMAARWQIIGALIAEAQAAAKPVEAPPDREAQ